MNDADTSQNPPSGDTPKSALGVSLRADYEALQNDLTQATELAADFQRQLAGKSNEVAHFKGLVERMQTDLKKLDAHVQELRQERHRLANDVMRATAMELELKRTHKEIERLQNEVTTMRDAGETRVNQLQIVNEDQFKEIVRLRAAVDLLKSRAGAPGEAGKAGDPGMQRQINDLTVLVKQLRGALDGQCRADRQKPFPPADFDPDTINLTFDT